MNFQDLNKYKTPVDFRGRSKAFVQLWWVVDSVFFKPSPQIMYAWRRFLLRLFGAKVGKGVIIRSSAKITYPWKLSIGDYSWIGDDVVLYTLGEIEIGHNVVVSQKTYLCTGSHDYKKVDFPIYSDKIVIEDQCWLATDVYVGPGVTIGSGTVVGARSSVFKSLPVGKICIGSPVKILKDRTVE
ncbi:colanic acid biosynthesis acetyltransferase WcaF [Sinomicrobium pectinilyticum]|uniref:Colanic acid biosynthesis acetyltransferase WcaF n=1 Tax=Sinomicrobium pectinilyticum TaxID=1084421 RepID=A0A3N0E732_SINP1|nr:putative colanic acid biosynthesis acetyltransferase [Sinomicrobium pectinilyticum]RNL83559.1 colanic acid biosynthesis acetyltransferase WcaF [Sinomicrobium pectinilyticum]